MKETTTQETVGTTTENVDTPPTEDVEKETEDKTEDKPVEPTEAEKATAKAEKKAAKVSYENRKLSRQIKSQEKNFNEQMSEMRELIQKSSPQAKAPDIANFENLEEYLEARDNFRDAKRQSKADNVSQDERDDSSYQEYFNQSRADMIDHGNDKFDDFELIVTDDSTKLSMPMCEALFDMEPDVQTDVAYFLGKNKKETLRIAKLRPERQFAELGKLEAKFSDKPAKKRTSNAPPPIEPIGGGDTPNDVISGQEDFDSYVRKRNKQRGRT